MNISIKQYILALFSHSEKSEKTSNIISELTVLDDNFKIIKNILEDPKINSSQKKKNLLDLTISADIVNFLMILKQENDYNKLHSIIKGLIKLRNEKTNTVEINCTSPYALTPQKKDLLTQQLKNKLKMNVIVNYSEVLSLIDGMILVVNDNLIDTSIKNKLNMIKNSLLE